MKYIEPAQLSYFKSLNKTLTRYSAWIIAVVLGLALIGAVLLISPKLQNPQVELTQPVGSSVFAGELATLPHFGQTFVPRQAGLRGIYLPLHVIEDQSQGAALTLHLRLAPEAGSDIRSVTLPLAELVGQNLARFSFEPLPDSFNTRYYFWLEATSGAGSARIELPYAGPLAYVDGALYRDDQPQDFQASFFLAYDRWLILLNQGHWLIQNLPLFLGLILLTLLPGAALLVWLLPLTSGRLIEETDNFNQIEWIALAAGLSVAVYPLLFLLTHLIGVRLGPGAMVVFLVLSTLALAIGTYRAWSNRPDGFKHGLVEGLPPLPRGSQRPRRSLLGLTLPHVLFWIIFLLSAGVRIFVLRGQDIPFWQDSYHHTLISQLLVDNGGLFNSWAPYAPMETFSYHFGFHTFVAAYQWLTGSTVFQAVLAIGQLMNLLTVPVAFLLGRRLGGDDWAGLFAALITGLLSQHPMFYVNWGRYTQLTGQVVLPVAMILTWLVLQQPKPNYKLISLAAICLAGLALTHYRVLVFYFCFIGPLFLFEWLQTDRSFRRVQAGVWRLGLVIFGAGLLLAPWLWQVIGNKLWSNTLLFFTPAATNSEFIQTAIQVTPSLFDYLPPFLVMVGLIGLLWGCWQRRVEIVITVAWLLALLIVSNPHFLYLPGNGIIPYFAVLIAAYLPFSVLTGFALAQGVQYCLARSRLAGGAIAVLVLGASLAGAAVRSTNVDLSQTMVAKPDLAAMAWIRQHTPAEAIFWSNARLAYGDSAIVGTDAGLWLPLLSGRKSLLLPLIYGSELTTPVDYHQQISSLYRQLQAQDLTSQAGWQALRQAGVTYLYIGQRRGETWRGTEQPLNPLALQASPYYEAVYRRDQVWIFALRQPQELN